MFRQRFPLWDENEDNGGSSGTGSPDLENLKAEVERLRNHSSKLLDEKKAVQAELKKFEGLDPENIQKLMEAFDSNEEAKLLAEGKIGEVVNKRTEKIRLDSERTNNEHAEEKASWEKEKRQLKKQYDDLLINTEIRRQAEKAGVLPAAIDDVIARSDGMFSLDTDGKIESRDLDGNLRTVKRKPLDPALFIEQLKENAPHFWPGSQGAGATGGAGNGATGGPNPFIPGKHFNLTEQARLMNKDPEKAQRLKAIADAVS